MSLDPSPVTVEQNIKDAIEAIIEGIMPGRPVAQFITETAPREYSTVISITASTGEASNRGLPAYDIDYEVGIFIRFNEASLPIETEANRVRQELLFELLQRRRLQSAGTFYQGVAGIRDEGITRIQTRLVQEAENADKKYLAATVQGGLLVPVSIDIEQLRFLPG